MERGRALSHPVSGMNIPALSSSTLQSTASAKITDSFLEPHFPWDTDQKNAGKFWQGHIQKAGGDATAAQLGLLSPTIRSCWDREFQEPGSGCLQTVAVELLE